MDNYCMLILDAKRILVLKALTPSSSIFAEIGVAKGTFSKQIMKHINPAELYLVDPWIYQDRPDYVMDGTNVSNEEGDRRYAHLVEHFSDVSEGQKVTLMREFSYDVVSQFEENSLDAVYIDAMHTYEAAKRDLLDFSGVVKEGGLIAGHDFTNSVFAKRKNFGVVQAVTEFTKEPGYSVLAVTNENYPSYFIYKGSVDSDGYERRKKLLIDRFNVLAELDAKDIGNTQHNVVVKDEKIVKSYFSLAA